MTRRIFIWALTAMAGVIVCVSIAFTVAPQAHKAAINSDAARGIIGTWNALRPSLNFGNNAACLEALATHGVKFTPVTDSTTELGCVIDNAVRVTAVGGMRLGSPAILTCRMATLLSEYAQTVLRPAAQAIGTEVAVIEHFGTYNCRPMREYSNLLSEHAFANAIDISGFRLKDGRMVSVLKNWTGGGGLGKFAQAVGNGACDVFPVALTPNHNALHRDHLHLDAGVWPRCGY